MRQKSFTYLRRENIDSNTKEWVSPLFSLHNIHDMVISVNSIS